MPLDVVDSARAFFGVAGSHVVLSIEPVVIFHVLRAKASATTVPESWAVFTETTPHVYVLSLALAVGFAFAALHLACGVWKSVVLLSESLWWGNDTGWIADTLSGLGCFRWHQLSATARNLVFNQAVGWWVSFNCVAAHGHWSWGHSHHLTTTHAIGHGGSCG